jgi:hypothetical protein
VEQDPAASNFHGSKACLLYVLSLVGGEQWLIATSDLSLEFLMGRALDNAMLNVGLKDAARGKNDDGL